MSGEQSLRPNHRANNDTDYIGQLEDLSAHTLYSAEVRRIPRIPRPEQPAYIAAAKAGDTDAKHRLLETCLNWVMAKAHAIHFEFEPAHSDVMDLVGHANLRMTEYLPQALTAADPITYLLSLAAREMRRYVFYQDPLIHKSKDHPLEGQRFETMSGDAGEWPLFDHLAAPNMQLVSGETREAESRAAHQPLYDAIGELPEAWQKSLTTFYGLSDRPSGTAEEVAVSLGVHEKTVERHVRYAKAELAQKLGQLAELPIVRSEERPHYTSPNRQGSASGL